ncbi:MAG: hypothetical protein AB199_03605 [Parcubacteria bacterium C7867-004]|nr:MAG: hypothetical protein AB199_03605 [Parcubacteria bacterium C7867-004]
MGTAATDRPSWTRGQRMEHTSNHTAAGKQYEALGKAGDVYHYDPDAPPCDNPWPPSEFGQSVAGKE